jgi:lipoate-protein ligase A
MAVDEALLESVRRSGRPVLRLYTWAPACLSLGRNQTACGIYDGGHAAAAGIDIVRRPTGGLAVLHDRELTYSVAAPLAPFGGPRAAYACITRALVEALRGLGVPAEQAAGARLTGAPRASDPCFQQPAPGEVVARGRKLVGSAQRCEGGFMLQHGSILLAGSQARVRDLAGQQGLSADGSITLTELLGVPPVLADLMGAMRDGFERTFGTRLAPGALDQDEIVRAERLTVRYRDDAWTWRR